MKKFIFWLIFLIIIAFAVFFAGWIRVPENNVALGFSTLTGYDTNLMKSGQINWRWQKLIPTTYTVRIYELDTVNTDIEVAVKLPSGDLYSSVMDGSPDFSLSAKFAISYKVKEDSLYGMITGGEIGENGLAQFYADVDARVKSAASNLMASSPQDIATLLKTAIQNQIPGIKLLQLDIIYLNFPDMELYNAAKRRYMEMQSQKQKMIEERDKENTTYTSEIDRRIELLKRYGELLTQYPILIEYYKTKDESLIPKGLNIKELLK